MVALEGIDAVRKRPGMYIGSTDSTGVQHLVWEIVDNSVDEALAGYATHIDIELNPDDSILVRDNGRGIPTDTHEKTGLSGVELALTKLHAGGKFGGSGYKSAGGLHGVGSSVVNALSSRLEATVYRGGKEHTVTFQRGIAGVFSGDKFTPKNGLRVSKDSRSAEEKKLNPTGTVIKWWHDKTIFLKDSQVNYEGVLERARTTAFLVSGLTITVRNNKVSPPLEESFKFDGGVGDMVDYLAPDKGVSSTIVVKGQGTFTESVPVLKEEGMVTEDVERVVDVNAAFRWGNQYDYVIKGFVNAVNTPQGGTHVNGLERGLLKVVNDTLKTRRGILKASEQAPILEDLQEGLTAVISVGFPEPQFLGQTKETLGTSEIRRIVNSLVVEQFSTWINQKKNAAESKIILEKIVNASRVRLAQRAQKELTRRKTALQGASMPAKLVDCAVSDPEHTELLICEGDSALGTMRAGRDSSYQALFPIRGKILNTIKATPKQVLDHAECSAIIQIIGAGSGRNFDVDNMRYNRVILAADADVDGAHIRTLLITLFWTQMRPLIEQGRLYSAVPPLFAVKTLGKNSEVIYFSDEAELQKGLLKLDRAGKKYSTPSRFKGLGEMDANELWDTTLDPSNRILRQITIEDADRAKKMLDLAMGDNIVDRKEWITNKRELLQDEDIDFQ